MGDKLAISVRHNLCFDVIDKRRDWNYYVRHYLTDIITFYIY